MMLRELNSKFYYNSIIGKEKKRTLRTQPTAQLSTDSCLKAMEIKSNLR